MLVFVYGTLKSGEPNHHVMSATAGTHRFISNGTTVDKFPLIISTQFNIPFLLHKPGEGNKIEGEVYEVDGVKLAVLDELEAYPTLYDRKEIKIKLSADGNTVAASLYLLKRWREELVTSGTPYLTNYSSNGPHGRQYVDRYVRAKEIIDDHTSKTNLYYEILGGPPADPILRKLNEQKAKVDLELPQ
ncbi:unnamed protein product [Caenorhabditis auriculariae]|uniref:Gamma-glutamylcyclotransferase family protein n=1 Tax=Caenorhabditis auriculariae TaxID=2777116 RepID=A0A8S1GYB7_9PELO|nr:unnamed protein product [Caenorhabditis auriculariae]